MSSCLKWKRNVFEYLGGVSVPANLDAISIYTRVEPKCVRDDPGSRPAWTGGLIL